MNTKSSSASRIAKLLVPVIASLSATFAVAAPAPVSAASKLSFCFSTSKGPHANQPVQLVKYNFRTRGWDWVRNGRSGANGCATFYNTPTDQYLAVQTYLKWGSDLYLGQTAYASPGGHWSDRGTGSWYYLCSQCSAD